MLSFKVPRYPNRTAVQCHCQLHRLKCLFVKQLRSGINMAGLQRGLLKCLQYGESQKAFHRFFHATTYCQKNVTARYRITPKGDKPLTYEMANPPHHIAHRKSWNSWNTTNLEGGLRPAETAVDDLFIRKFMTGTWHNLFESEVIIKRQHNIIRIVGIVRRTISARKMYFLIGYCEEILSYWLQCPVKLELQTVEKKDDVIFKYV